MKEVTNLNSSDEASAGYVPINGTNLYFKTKGMGKALILIHAGIADSRMWQRQFEEFSRSFFVICCDMRGFGQSRNLSSTFAFYEDIAALLQHLHIKSAYVIGSSFGGSVAIDFALAYPEIVTSLVLAAPTLGGYNFESIEMLDFFAAEREALAQGDLAYATELNLKMWMDGFNRQTETVSHEIREQVREMQFNIFSRSEDVDASIKQLIPPAIEQLHKISAPTLVIVGDNDVAEFRSISKLISQSIQNARYVIMSGTAHLPSMEKPNEFNQLIFDFLEK